MKNLKYLFLLLLLLRLVSQAQTRYVYYEGLAVEKQVIKGKNKYGFVNTKHKLVIACEYDTVIKPFFHGLASVMKEGKAGVIDTRGKTVVPFQYRNIGELQRSLIPVQNFKGLWGFCDLKGQLRIPCNYDNFRAAPKNRLIVQQRGKWGMITVDDKIVIPFQYRDISHIAHKHYKVTRLNTWQVKTFNENRPLFTAQYDSLYYMGDGLYKYCLRGKYGIITNSNQPLTSSEFLLVDTAAYGRITVKNTEGWGLVDRQGTQLIECKYRRIHIDTLGIRVQQNDKQWALFSHQGMQLTDFKYSYIFGSSDGLFRAVTTDRWFGFLNSKGFSTVPFIFKGAVDFKHGSATVNRALPGRNGETSAVINKSGDYIIESDLYHWYQTGLLEVRNNAAHWVLDLSQYQDAKKLNDEFVAFKLQGLWGVCDMRGGIFLAPTFDSISSASSDGLFVVHVKNKIGVCNKWGDFFIPMTNQFQMIYQFHEGRAKMMIKGLYGFIDKYGNVWLSPQYSKAGEFKEGRVPILIRNKWGFMDEEERLKVQPYYAVVSPFSNGVSLVEKAGKFNFVNKEGKELHATDLQQIIALPSGKFLLQREGYYGLANQEGKEVLAVRFDEIKEIENGYYLVRKEQFCSLYDSNLNLIIPAVNEGLEVFPKDNIVITGSKSYPEDLRME